MASSTKGTTSTPEGSTEYETAAEAPGLPPPGRGRGAGGRGAAAGKAQALNEKCPVSGAPVDKAVLVSFKDRQVAFCCGNCKKKFEADPSKFAAKIGG